jgi:2-polyprenyl-3-methyl-5-hydroxy-6-metoxy-1,4-benzoquinol methylase
MNQNQVTAEGADNWDAHWANYAEGNTLSPAQVYRSRLIEKALGLSRAPQPVRLLELGCGHGAFASEVLRAHPDIDFVGLDGAETGVAIARRNVPAGVFVQADLADPASLPQQYQGFATHAVCSEVLEHVDDPAAVLRNARALFAPGCRLVITVPAGPMSAFDRHIGHRRHFSPDALESMFRSAGLELEMLSGAGFPFFNLYRLAVVARGAALIRDVSSDDAQQLPLSARALIRVFSTLFRFNRDAGRRGWQLVAVAVEPGART